jgi:methylase of polypeptide subunit release factors
MKLDEFNGLLKQLGENPCEDSLMGVAHGLLDWMGVKKADKHVFLIPKTQKLKGYLQTRKEFKRADLKIITESGQPIEVRLGNLHNLRKQQLYYLVDRDTRIDAWQNEPPAIQKISKRPYIIHFATNAQFDRLMLILHENGQKRIVTLRDRLSQTQYTKILGALEGIGQLQSKYDIRDKAWKALDLKEVNKLFYREVKTRYDALVAILKERKQPEKNAEAQFAVRLIGRYIFCWFLKEKGIIDKSIIESKTIKATASYYENVLRKLFFNTLNTEIGLRETPAEIESDLHPHFKRIPYLNGGLFEPTAEDGIFTELELNDWLHNFVQVLEEYDFTVDESSPSYQQIAIDPEMLGRIFENLLASINPETEKLANERKAFGAFYTPREIVEYMVNQSLRCYLDTHLFPAAEETYNSDDAPQLVVKEPNAQLDIFRATPRQLTMVTETESPYKTANEIAQQKREEERLKQLKVKLDKFFEEGTDNPFNAEETHTIRTLLDNCKVLDPACGSGAFPMGVLYKLEQLHEALGVTENTDALRLRILSNNIFGIDIMPMAVDISRLRAWLAIVLVCEYKPTQPKNNFGVRPLPNLDFKFVCANTLVDVPEDEYVRQMAHDDLARFDVLTREYFNAKYQQKDELKHEIQECLNAITETHSIAIRQIIDSSARHEKSDSKKSKELDKLKERYQQEQSRWQSYTHIFENKPVEFFKTRYFFPQAAKGFDIVIGNPPYVTKSFTDDFKKYLRQHFKTAQYQLELYVAFIERATDLLNWHGTLSFIVPNSWMKNMMFTECRKFILENYFLHKIFPNLKNVFQSASVDTSIIIASKTYKNIESNFIIEISDFVDQQAQVLNKVQQSNLLINSGYIFDIQLNDLGRRIVNKMKTFKSQSEYFDVTRGVNPYDKARGQSQSVISNKDYHSTYKKDKTFVPELRGKHLQGFNYVWDGQSYISYGPWLAAPRENKYFEGERLLMRQILSEKLICTVIEEDFIIDQSIFIAKLKPEYEGKISSKFLLAQFSSKLFAYFFKYSNNEFDDLFPKIKIGEFKSLPFKVIDLNLQRPFIEIVDGILKSKKNHAQFDSSLYEHQIDLMVYHLYDLTLEEARVIDASVTEEEWKVGRNMLNNSK